MDPLLASMALPVLAIKPRNACHPFTVSTAPVAITDVPATIAELAGVAASVTGLSAYAVDPNMARQRRHLVYGYGINPESEGYLSPRHRVSGGTHGAIALG